jgi:HEAT repeat protein
MISTMHHSRLALALIIGAMGIPPRSAPARPASDPVTVTDDGRILIGQTAIGTLPLPAGKRTIRVARPTVSGHRLLHVKVSGSGGRAAELLVSDDGGQRQQLFAGPTGPQGVDGEWSQHLSVDESQVLVFQRREGIRRCDDAPMYLFPRLYDFAARKLRSVARVERPEAITVLRATRDVAGGVLPVGDPLNTFSLVFASTHAGDEQRAANLSAPVEAEDGKPETAWAEGLGSAGQGELLIARAQPSPYRLKALRIIPGHAASAKTFREANRLKSLLLHLSPKHRYRLLFPRDPSRDAGKPADPYWVILPQPVSTTCATLVIEEVYAGSSARPPGNGGRTAISELRFFTELEFAGGLAQIKRDLASPDATRGTAAVAVLARLDRVGIELAAKIAATASGVTLGRAVQVLVRSRLPVIAAPLAAALPRADRATRIEALAALTRLGPTAATAIVPLLRARSAGLRVEIARVLGVLGGLEARQALIAEAGNGPDPQRAAVVDGLGLLQAPEDRAAVVAALASSTASRRQADLVHALGRLGAPERTSTAAGLARLWPTTRDFEVRYRLISSIGRLDAVGQLPLLIAVGQRDADPILRWLATEQLRRASSPMATMALRQATRDRDPRVRSAAALVLAGRPSEQAVGVDLARLLTAERWAMPAAAAAEALGRHCCVEGGVALRRAVASGREAVDVRALNSLAQCKPPGLATDLLAVAADAGHRAALRTRALGLLTPLLARGQARAVVRLFNDLRRRAATSDSEEEIAVAAAAALAATGAESAAEAAADALALDPHEAIRGTAAAALGQLCRASTKEVLRRALSDASPLVQRAAREAVKRCRF